MLTSVKWAEDSLMNTTPTGPCQLKYPSTFNVFALPSAHQCQHNCPWSTPAAWPMDGAGLVASCKYNRGDREGSLKPTHRAKSFLKAAELSPITTLKCWQKSIFIPAPGILHSGLQSNTVGSWVSQRKEMLTPFSSKDREDWAPALVLCAHCTISSRTSHKSLVDTSQLPWRQNSRYQNRKHDL